MDESVCDGEGGEAERDGSIVDEETFKVSGFLCTVLLKSILSLWRVEDVGLMV